MSYDEDYVDPSCPICGEVAEWWFDRSICAEPCGSMHYVSECCGWTDCELIETHSETAKLGGTAVLLFKGNVTAVEEHWYEVTNENGDVWSVEHNDPHWKLFEPKNG